MTRILGIAGYYHDSSATLLVDGEIVAAAQEERFTRIKHDASFPLQAAIYCLEEADCQLQDLDAIIFYDKPLLKFERLLETYLAHSPRGFLSFLKAMPIWLKEKLYLKTVLRNEFRQIIYHQRSVKENSSIESQQQLDKRPKLPKLLFSEHHQSHAASAFYASPFDKAAVLCLDGVGEWATSSLWIGKDAKLTPLAEIQFPHSLGLLYSAFTYYCGFRVNTGEYKLMGLAPYGEPIYVEKIYQHLINVSADGSFYLNLEYFDFPTGKAMTSSRFHELFDGAPHAFDQPPTQKQMDLARSIQVVTEEILLKIINHAHIQTGMENLCLAGGIALNCVANGRIEREGPFTGLWIQPAAGDAGGSLGAAYVAWHDYFQQPRDVRSSDSDKMQGSYLGPGYTNHEIETLLESMQIPYQILSGTNKYLTAARIVSEGHVLGWFQGRMEFGPRALGNRSIIGDPRSTEMQEVMNLKIKFRESFRPFAPAILIEKVADIFNQKTASPYMLIVADVLSEHLKQTDIELSGLDKLKQIRSEYPAITHVDNSARVQTVDGVTNPEFYALIRAFYELTACPLVINTSFNVRGEPPVCSPLDGINCFLRTDMDYLVINDLVLDKTQMPGIAISRAKKAEFEMD